MSQNLQNLAIFQKLQLANLVDFEKCCKTQILLQNSEPIQPKTSNILPKFCQPTLSDGGAQRRDLGAGRSSPGGPSRRGARRRVRGTPTAQRLIGRSHGAATAGSGAAKMHFSKNAFFENAFFENFANFWRVRSRLFQNEILQENMRSTAFFKLYKIT